MVRSMTGFGRAEMEDDLRKIVVEIKSVNSRFLDFNIKMPKKFFSFDNAIRTVLKEYMTRGKVDVFISCEDLTESRISIAYNPEIASQYLAYFKQMEEEFNIPNDITATKLAGFPDVFSMEEISADQDELWKALDLALRQAAVNFTESRQKEGDNLRKDLLEKLDHLKENVELVIARAPEILEEYKDKLKQKTKDLLESAQIDDARIAAEVVLFADKICTDEETVRLLSHIDHMKQTLDAHDSVGRKLDFIAQELNREANTILSKANDLKTSEVAIELKTDIEKIREQIQNIE